MSMVVKDQSMAVTIAALLFAAVTAITTWVTRVDTATAPASAWFTVDEFHVPDHSVGENPVIQFERTIKKDMTGRWSVETQLFSGSRWVTVCRGSGVSNYTTDEDLPRPITLDWYRGSCDEKPGLYRLQTVWLFSDETGLTRSVQSESNEFTVD